MLKIGLIIAGGVGKRMGFDIPKQFIEINDKPVIIYTLETFQKHPMIDEIVIVCIDGWEDILQAYLNKFKISKVSMIIKGGDTAQESIRNGINSIYQKYSSNDNIVIIHDGVRPLIDKEVLSDVISKCIQFGNGVSSMPYNEQIFVKNDEFTTINYIPRDSLRRVSTPQAYRLDKLKWAYDKAFTENIGIGPSSYTNTMMVDLGEKLYFAAGSDKNIKLTTKENLDIFKIYLQMEK